MELILGLITLIVGYLVFNYNTIYAALAVQLFIMTISIILLSSNITNIFSLIFIMIYVGAIFVLFLFIIMLLHNEENKHSFASQSNFIIISLDIFCILCFIIAYFKKSQIIYNNDKIFEEIYYLGIALANDKINVIILLMLLLFAILAPICLHDIILKTNLRPSQITKNQS